MNYKHIIFDLDGTLIDTSQGILDSIEATISLMNLAEQNQDSLRKFIGPPIKEAFKTCFKLDDSNANKAVRIFREFYESNIFHALPYAGIENLCLKLKKSKLKLSVASYKPEIYVKKILQHFNMAALFDSIHGTVPSKPLSKSDIIHTAISETNEKNCVYIGDTFQDYVAANEAQISFIAVTWGFGIINTRETDKNNFVGVVSTITDLEKLILGDIL